MEDQVERTLNMKCDCGGIHAAGFGDTSTGHSVLKVQKFL